MTRPVFARARALPIHLAMTLLLLGCVTAGDQTIPGSRALTSAEYVGRYAGQSVALTGFPGGPVVREIYFASNGDYKVVDVNIDVIQLGRWQMSDGPNGPMLITLQTAGFRDGRLFVLEPDTMTLFVSVLPDGTASVFARSSEGTQLARQPLPTPGFQRSARYEEIKRRVEAGQPGFAQ